MSGDFALASTVEWLGSGGQEHRKACLMVRQSLSPDSAYVDVAVHGNGLTSLQYRAVQGGVTSEIQASAMAPARVGIERQGDVVFMTLPGSGKKAESQLLPSGSFMRVKFTDPVYVGLAVCAHDDAALEKAQFRQTELRAKPARAGDKPVLHSSLEVVKIDSHDRRVVYHAPDHFEAPNWSRDGQSFVFNSQGRIYRLPLEGGAPTVIDTGSIVQCNNDHGISPDGRRLAISATSSEGKSVIYTLPLEGGSPRLMTALGPSYWHGWSPDGLTLTYCALRDGNYGIFTIPAQGGEERRLTTAKALDDGPDYTADGQFIYFNSDRSGSMQIWRMQTDGTHLEQVTSDSFNNWFPHPSPDGRWVVFLSYEPGVSGHPANKPVRLRIMPLGGGHVEELAQLFGGQGTINVPSWSPDSRQVAFVSYELLLP
jgi:hypothetical protein